LISVQSEKNRYLKQSSVKSIKGKLRTKPADQICSLPDGRSAGLHYLYTSISELRSATCHVESHRL